MDQDKVRRAWYRGHITGPYKPSSTSQKKTPIFCRPFVSLKKKVISLIGKKPKKDLNPVNDDSSVSTPISDTKPETNSSACTSGEPVYAKAAGQDIIPPCPSVDSITIHRSRYASHHHPKMTSLPSATNLSIIHEDPEVISFNEICNSHPELKDTVIQTNVIMKPRQPRMARVMDSLIKPFSSGRAEREWASGQKFKIVKPKVTSSDELAYISPLSPDCLPPEAFNSDHAVHAVPSMPAMPSAQPVLPMTLKALPPLPPMPNMQVPAKLALRPPAPGRSTSPPLAPQNPRPSTPPGFARQGHLTPPSSPPTLPLFPRSPRSPDVSFWMGRVMEIHEILGHLMVEHADLAQRRIFHQEFTALSNLLSVYNATMANADTLDKVVTSMHTEAINQKHEMIVLVDRAQQEYNLLSYYEDSDDSEL